MMIDGGWLFLIGFVLFLCAFACLMIMKVVKYSWKETRIHNYDAAMKHMIYQTGLPPEEIYERLTKGEEREHIRYDFDPEAHRIKLYWHGSRYGHVYSFEVKAFSHEHETVLILKRLDLRSGRGGSINADYTMKEWLDRMNDFWHHLADARPISYYNNNSSYPWK